MKTQRSKVAGLFIVVDRFAESTPKRIWIDVAIHDASRDRQKAAKVNERLNACLSNE